MKSNQENPKPVDGEKTDVQPNQIQVRAPRRKGFLARVVGKFFGKKKLDTQEKDPNIYPLY